jgi:nucleoside-diphosphate-sugar epimerase
MILVTGATGLVGSYLVLHLIENNENVRAMYRNPKGIQKTKSLFKLYDKESLFEKIEWIQADINDIASLELAFKNIEFVYHCAAFISFDPKDEAILRKTNIEGTANIVNFCIEYAIKKLCYVSSIAALGDLKENENTLTEFTEWNPEKYHSDYAISKFGAEIEVFRGQQEGLDTVIVNPGVILGCVPNLEEWPTGSGAIFLKTKKGMPFYTNGSSSFVAVDDVVSIMVQLMKSPISGERFIVMAENVSYKNLIFTISNALKTKPPQLLLSPWVLGIAWRLDWFFSTFLRVESQLSKALAESLNSTFLYSDEKLKSVFPDYQFQKIEDYCYKIANKL